ncbi:potassium channel family protein [Methanosphaera sp.]
MDLKSLNINISEENKRLLLELKDILLIILTLIDFIFIFIITFYDISINELRFMALFDLILCIFLFFNLIFIYKHSDKSFWPFIRTHIVDILSIIPFNFIFLRYMAIFRVIRIIRVLQIFQIFKIYNVKNYNFGALKYFVRNRLLKVMGILIVFYVILSSVILFKIDPSFTSLFDSIWYNIVTLTGVGYGDITPLSQPGKIIGMLTIIMGVLFISIFTAAMSALYMEKQEEDTRHAIKLYVKELKSRNKNLQKEIVKLDNDINVLHEKLDNVTQLLDEEIKKNNMESVDDET